MRIYKFLMIFLKYFSSDIPSMSTNIWLIYLFRFEKNEVLVLLHESDGNISRVKEILEHQYGKESMIPIDYAEESSDEARGVHENKTEDTLKGELLNKQTFYEEILQKGFGNSPEFQTFFYQNDPQKEILNKIQKENSLRKPFE
jgi:hypothetical protein